MITIQQLDHSKWLVRDIQHLQISGPATIMAHGTFPTLDAAISHLIPPGTGKDLKLRIVTLGIDK